jgi:hypothetical protein
MRRSYFKITFAKIIADKRQIAFACSELVYNQAPSAVRQLICLRTLNDKPV